MTTSLSMPEFVARIHGLTSPALDSRGMQAFLDTHRIVPATLEPYLRYADGRYTRHLVFKNHAVELLVLCWARGSHAPIHGHEGELCWARVERGHLRFTSYREVSRTPLRLEPVVRAVDGRP